MLSVKYGNMLTETLSGKCPCCGYDKLLQRYGSFGYIQLDGCPNCGFGYASNNLDYNCSGENAWLDYGSHILALQRAGKEVPFPEELNQVIKEKGSVGTGNEDYDKHQIKFDLSYKKFREEHNTQSNINLRRMIFHWAESQTRSNDVQDTVFNYKQEDINEYLSTNPIIFNKTKNEQQGL